MLKRSTLPAVNLLTLSLLVTAMFVSPAYSRKGKKKPVDTYYKQKPLFNPYPDVNGRKAWNVKNFGPVGIGINLEKPNFTMKIVNVEKGSPAEKTGKLKKGQIIESINGITLKDRDPREILGDILTVAEAKDGIIRLKIKGEGVVAVKIPVMGSYSDSWPVNCSKSDKIVRKLADLLATQEKPGWGAVLFMLSTGEEKDLAVVKRWMKGIDSVGSYAWQVGYLGPGVCEYYLRTGDQSVIPLIKKMIADLKENQYNNAWAGRGKGSFGYMGGGHMNAAGVHCVTFLLLARMCGVEVDENLLQSSLTHFFRYAGRGNVAYGDQLPEGGFRDNGKSGGLAVAMAAAARLTPDGEKSIYANARDNSAMKSFYATNWFHAAHTGGGIGEIWHHAAMGLVHKKRPQQYRSYLDTRRWVMELSRRHDGAIGIAGMTDGYDASATDGRKSWGNYFALTYTIPRQKLQLFGAPKTQWCKSYKLPIRPWGTAEDDIFQSPAPASHPAISMQDMKEEKIETDASLAVLNKINDPNVSDKTLLKYLHHPEFGLRSGAMRVVVEKGKINLIMPMLKSSDARLRHVGILAITGMFKGRGLQADQITAEMYELAGKMVANPNESWWVKQDAIKALKRGGLPVIAKFKNDILKYVNHKEWWLQAAAIDTLIPLVKDKAHADEVIPPIAKALSESTVSSVISLSRGISNELAKANAQAKKLAYEKMVKVYKAVPADLKDGYGQLVNGGASIKRSNIGAILRVLPNGEEFVRQTPKKTTAYGRTGKESDMYRYSGKFKPNKSVVGVWHWAVWPRPKKKEDVIPLATKWAKRKKQEKPKVVLHIADNGVVKGKSWSGYFWTDDMLIGVNDGIARKMWVKNIAGKDFLIFERGGFEPGEKPKDWNEAFDIYMRAK